MFPYTYKLTENLLSARTEKQFKTIVNSLVISDLDYCNCVGERQLNQLQLIQDIAVKAATGKYKLSMIT